jgi:hypothetical protein
MRRFHRDENFCSVGYVLEYCYAEENAMEENIISWNVTNWITVVLMAAIGFFLLGLIQKAVAGKMAGNTNATS